MAFEVRLLRREDDRGGFDCGETPVNTFLQRFAHHHQFKHGVSVTWVAVENGKIGAFARIRTMNRPSRHSTLGSRPPVKRRSARFHGP